MTREVAEPEPRTTSPARAPRMGKRTVIVGFFVCFLAGVGLMGILEPDSAPDLEGERSAADGAGHGAAPIPVTSADPTWGRPDALVTIVEFADFHCPFCRRPQATLAAIKQAYRPDRVRVVWKNNPLPVHPKAPRTHEDHFGSCRIQPDDDSHKF